jgi:hypothetical protein
VPITPQAVVAADTTALEHAQNDVAQRLVDVQYADDDHFDRDAILRSRAILQRKRVDEALPLLSFLAPFRCDVERLAHQVIAEYPRPAKLAGISDAMQIARRAAESSTLRSAAERDLFSLETRFVCDPMTKAVRPRRAPFFGMRDLSGGTKALAFKGFGPHARVHVYERKLAST